MRSEVVSVVVVVSLVHTAMWLGLNADTQAAESRFTVLLRQAGNSQHARAYGASSLAGYYRDGGKFEESLQAFEEASRYDPENGRYHVGRAYVLSIQGNLEAAESALKQALELTPDRLEALINLGKLYLEAGRKAEAQSVFVRAVNRNGESEQALHGLATAHYRLGDYAAADALYRGAIRLVPNNAAYHIDLGNTLLQREKYDGAEASLRTALGIDSGSTRARMVLGAVHFGRGEYDLASRVFSKVTSVHPDRADAHLNLGLSLKAAGHLGRARVHLEQMLKLSPNDPESDEIRGMLEDLSGGDLNQ